MSTLNVNVIQNLSGVEKYLPMTRVNFYGVLGGVIRSSGNISSIADNGQDSQIVARNIQTAGYQIWLATGATDSRDCGQVCLNIMR